MKETMGNRDISEGTPIFCQKVDYWVAPAAPRTSKRSLDLLLVYCKTRLFTKDQPQLHSWHHPFATSLFTFPRK